MLLELLITFCVLVGGFAFFGMAGRTALAVLLAPGLYSIAVTWPRCWAAPIISGDGCMANFLSAPFAIMIGPIAHYEEDLPNPFPGILLITLAIVIVWTAVAFLIKRHRRGNVSK